MQKNSLKGGHILLVEDEDTLAIGLEYNLSEEGYQVTRAQDGKQAIALFEAQVFDLIILDLMLPYYSGFEVAQKIRAHSPQIPILILTAKTGVNDRVRGLETGADDYLTKPFHLQELLLRVHGMLKRKMWYKQASEPDERFYFGANEVNFSNLRCRRGDSEFQLTPQEAFLLKYLIQKKGKIISRQELLEKVWNIHSDEIETRTVDNFIARLRKYFEPDPTQPVYFKSIRSLGYLFNDTPEPGRLRKKNNPPSDRPKPED